MDCWSISQESRAPSSTCLIGPVDHISVKVLNIKFDCRTFFYPCAVQGNKILQCGYLGSWNVANLCCGKHQLSSITWATRQSRQRRQRRVKPWSQITSCHRARAPCVCFCAPLPPSLILGLARPPRKKCGGPEYWNQLVMQSDQLLDHTYSWWTSDKKALKTDCYLILLKFSSFHEIALLFLHRCNIGNVKKFICSSNCLIRKRMQGCPIPPCLGTERGGCVSWKMDCRLRGS